MIGIGVVRLWEAFPAPTDFWTDERYAYLRAAQRLLAQGWSFFVNDTYSYHTAPLGYVWPALWQLEPNWIRIANSALYLLCVPMLWRTGMRLGGHTAATVCTLLFVAHEGLSLYAPRILTEPLFLFGLILLLLALAEIVFGTTQRALWVWSGALGLAITLLTRPVLQIVALGALFVLTLPIAGLARRLRFPVERFRSVRTAVRQMLLLAAVVPALVIVKNGVFFDVWNISTGSGAALYQGVHPATRGVEPIYLGLEYDINDMVTAVSPRVDYDPLLAESDAIERRVALGLIQGMSPGDSIALFAKKFYYWLAYHPIILSRTPAHRVQRFIELFLIAAFGVWAIAAYRAGGWQGALQLFVPRNGPTSSMAVDLGTKRWAFFLGLSGTLLIMLVQMLPVLHNIRYGSGFLEIFIILLAAMAVSGLLGEGLLGRVVRVQAKSTPAGAPSSGGLYVIALSILAAATWFMLTKRYETFSLDPKRLGPMAVVLDKMDRGVATAQDMKPLPQSRWQVTGPQPTLIIPFMPPKDLGMTRWHFLNAVWTMRLAVKAAEPRRCRTAHVTYAPHQPPLPQFNLSQVPPVLHIDADGRMRSYAVHGNRELRPAGAGELRLAFDCPIGTEIEWVDAQLLRSTLIEAAVAFVHHGTPINPYHRAGKSH